MTQTALTHTALTQTTLTQTTLTHTAPAQAALPDMLQSLEARRALLAGMVAALAAPDDLGSEQFEAALADPAAQGWPFDLARAHLLYGERLRRDRQIARARRHLAEALRAFQLLGATSWADRAAAELAATAPAHRREPSAAAALTAQETQVAKLAAAGLSNREIAARLLMSHRTVSAHLYRIFPKLGISSRAALRDALTRSSQAA